MQTIVENTAAEPHQSVRVLRRVEVEHRTGLSRSSLYEHIAAGRFPRPITLSSRRVGWLSHEVEAWIADRIRERDAGKAA